MTLEPRLKFFIISVAAAAVYATILLYLNASNDNSIFYRTASKILGSEPMTGDGAFHYPLGWILILILSGILGALTAGIFLFLKARMS